MAQVAIIPSPMGEAWIEWQALVELCSGQPGAVTNIWRMDQWILAHALFLLLSCSVPVHTIKKKEREREEVRGKFEKQSHALSDR